MAVLASKRMRLERHCSFPEYLARRAFSGLLYWRGYRYFYPERPLYTPGALRFLDTHLRPEWTGFEWGSGYGTLWLARKLAHLYSVEHDVAWHDRIGDRLPPRTNVQLLLRPLPGDGYIRAIDEPGVGEFDFIAIDGRRRMDCLAHAATRLAPGGLILLDDSHRPRYSGAPSLLRHLERLRFDFGLLQTTIWRRAHAPGEPPLERLR